MGEEGSRVLYLIGGHQRELRPLHAGGGHWYRYDRAVIVALDTATGAMEKRLEYVSPPEACAPESPPILFKQGTIEGDLLHVCTTTEVLVFRLPSFERVAYLSHPWFHDLHHVRPTPRGTWIVVNTGLEMVMEVEPGGEVVRTWSVTGEDPWRERSPEVDYRRVPSLKPYVAHANHAFMLGDDVWATRHLSRDAICVSRPGPRIDIGVGQPHDGLVADGGIYFTTVNGHVVVADPETGRIRDSVALQELERDRTLLGWCRGIWTDGPRAWVGFSRLRPTRSREYVAWVGKGFRRVRSSHVSCYDVAERRLLARFDVEDLGLSAVFSVLPGHPRDPLANGGRPPAQTRS